MLLEKIQLEDDERVLMQVRKHWFILFVQLFGLVIVGLLPLIGYLVFVSLGFFKFITATIVPSIPILIALYSAWLLLIWMAIFNVWTNYYLDVWTITTKRLIAVDQRGLFHRTVSSFRLERLQDTNIEINGIIATFLNFGMIEAQTASESGDDFRAYGLPDPRGIKSVMQRAADDLMKAYGGRFKQADGM